MYNKLIGREGGGEEERVKMRYRQIKRNALPRIMKSIA
jgi:hypothetical protein